MTLIEADARYLQLAGGTLLGQLRHDVGAHIEQMRDGFGYAVSGGGIFYKRAGAGIVLRESSGGQQPQLEDNNGQNQRDIIDTINGDARYMRSNAAVPGYASALIAMQQGQYYAGCQMGGHQTVRLSFEASTADGLQSIELAAEFANIAGTGYAAFTVISNMIHGAKLIDEASITSGPAYTVRFRAARSNNDTSMRRSGKNVTTGQGVHGAMGSVSGGSVYGAVGL
jgi:hypothetical protein